MSTKKGENSTKHSNLATSNTKLTHEEFEQVQKAKELLLPLKKKYNLDIEKLLKLTEEELQFPISILNKRLTVLGSIVKYLKEEKKLSLHSIAEIIGRDERNVWNIYHNSKKKYPERFSKRAKIWIPVSIFSSKLSALESVVSYLKDELSLNYRNIAILLERDERTIWTVYQRAKKKHGK